jgi:hypothetical protein
MATAARALSERRPSTSRAVPARPAPGRATASRPDLQVVPARGRAVRLAFVGLGSLVVVLFAVAAFQTRIAENQLDLDRIDNRIAEERELFTRLRLDRAGLMSPERLMAEAQALGMEPATAIQFAPVPPQVVAQVAVAANGLSGRQRSTSENPLRAYGQVKALLDGVNDGGD